ncbi:MAG: metallophosphoesterase, partial [Kofleriaceae bacterium]|nr:metallophosphoesterase [Kofleriaceae bacterium]
LWAAGDFAELPQRATMRLGPALTAALEAQLADDARQRVAAVYASAQFTIDAAPLEVIEVRMRYHDAVAVAINGWVMARRQWPRDQGSAARPHGPEWETFYIAVAPGLLAPGRNTLSLQVRPFRKRALPEMEVEVVAAPSVRLVRGPLVQRVTPTTATVVAEVSAAVPASLRWTSGDTGQWQTIASPVGKRHVFDLAGLPSGRITYEVHAGASHPTANFFTAPRDNAVVRLAVYGDVRGGHDVHRRIVDAMQGEAPDAVLTTGDMVLRGSDEADWQRFFAVIEPLAARVPYYPSMGNHDLGRAGDSARRAMALFALPVSADASARQDTDGDWYSIDIANVHLVFLDSNRYDQAAQLTWLEHDLRAARGRNVRAVIALTHAGPWSRGIHHGSKLARERYVPLLVQFGVDLLLSGHEHLYQRGQFAGLRYIVSGGGGASLYSILCGTNDRKPCAIPDGMLHIEKVHHYVMLTITDRQLEVCPRHPDGSPLEPCLQWPLAAPAPAPAPARAPAP